MSNLFAKIYSKNLKRGIGKLFLFIEPISFGDIRGFALWRQFAFKANCRQSNFFAVKFFALMQIVGGYGVNIFPAINFILDTFFPNTIVNYLFVSAILSFYDICIVLCVT